MLIVVFIGTPPNSVEECFSILNENRFLGLLRLDILTVFVNPLYYLLFYSIYLAFKRTHPELDTLSTILVFIGLTLFLSTSSVFEYLNLSDKYALATTDFQKNQLVAAGEAIMESDIWHGTSSLLGGLLLQTGALLISLIMLRSVVFNRLIAYTGVFIFGLDLIHIIIGLFLPTIGNILMVMAGTFYLIWFPLIGLRFFRLYRNPDFHDLIHASE